MRQKGEFEFRIIYLERLVNWMLYHGTFDKQLTPEDLQAMEDSAKEEVQKRVYYQFDIPQNEERAVGVDGPLQTKRRRK